MSQGSPLATPIPWDLVAPAYTEEVVPMFEAYAREALRLAAPAPGSRVVDVACGPGTLAVIAGRAGHEVDAIDFSPAMIESLEARIRAESLSGITPRVGDGQALPLSDGTYAAAFSMFGVIFFPDRAKGLAELRRVLAPGARAVVGSWPRADTVPVLAAAFGALREALSKLPGPGGPPSTGGAMVLETEEACRAEMSAVFADVEVHQVPYVQRYPSADALWASYERTTAPLVLLRSKLGPERWAPVAESIRAAIHRVTGDGPVEVTMPAWLTVGVAA